MKFLRSLGEWLLREAAIPALVAFVVALVSGVPRRLWVDPWVEAHAARTREKHDERVRLPERGGSLAIGVHSIRTRSQRYTGSTSTTCWHS